jgi:putative endonuclease
MATLFFRQTSSTKALGDAAEDAALAHLQKTGLRLLARNYRTPGRGGGEIDLVMQARDGTLVFVEVRRRSDPRFGGAAASVGGVKQARIVFAARHYLLHHGGDPACRFDVVSVQPTGIEWIQGAFDAG